MNYHTELEINIVKHLAGSIKGKGKHQTSLKNFEFITKIFQMWIFIFTL